MRFHGSVPGRRIDRQDIVPPDFASLNPGYRLRATLEAATNHGNAPGGGSESAGISPIASVTMQSTPQPASSATRTGSLGV